MHQSNNISDNHILYPMLRYLWLSLNWFWMDFEGVGANIIHGSCPSNRLTDYRFLHRDHCQPVEWHTSSGVKNQLKMTARDVFIYQIWVCKHMKINGPVRQFDKKSRASSTRITGHLSELRASCYNSRASSTRIMGHLPELRASCHNYGPVAIIHGPVPQIHGPVPRSRASSPIWSHVCPSRCTFAPSRMRFCPSRCTFAPTDECLPQQVHVCLSRCTSAPAGARLSQQEHVCPSKCTFAQEN